MSSEGSTPTSAHTAAAIDDQGRLVGHREFPAHAGGYSELLAWMRSEESCRSALKAPGTSWDSSKLCGGSPKPASSGQKSGRHRLNRGGDRAANSALYIITIVRLRHHQPTRDYVTRRTAEGLSKREIIRCLIGGVWRS